MQNAWNYALVCQRKMYGRLVAATTENLFTVQFYLLLALTDCRKRCIINILNKKMLCVVTAVCYKYRLFYMYMCVVNVKQLFICILFIFKLLIYVVVILCVSVCMCVVLFSNIFSYMMTVWSLDILNICNLFYSAENVWKCSVFLFMMCWTLLMPYYLDLKESATFIEFNIVIIDWNNFFTATVLIFFINGM